MIEDKALSLYRCIDLDGTGITGAILVPAVDNAGNTLVRLVGDNAGAIVAPVLVNYNDNLSPTNLIQTGAFLYGFDGVNADRLRVASADVQALATKIGVLAVAKIGDWSINSDPAAATQATITRAAGAAGVRHICTSIFASFSAGATAGAAVKVYLRDGLTGAGAILWSGSLAVPIGDTRNISITDLSIVGSDATAMTLEFAAAGAATTLQNVSLTGYDTV